ncbi:MucR family transcriptional regulator [Actinoplanes sp. NPDC051494]|uniref:MucR family transcriptional regulator n=1 Tax=Actinoplanes sp. NPDC051494 TaxID=3363907 RepID=UPI003789A848
MGRTHETHGHLWRLPDGTGLHAPPGELAVEESTGRLCCHLCGRWYTSLGSHVRAHGHTAGSYRAAMGLCRREPLVAAALSTAIRVRQARRFDRDEALRAAFVAGADRLRRAGPVRPRAEAEPPQRVARRRAALQAGRDTVAVRRDRDLAGRLARLGHGSLGGYLRTAYAGGASLDALAASTGLGRARLRAALDQAGVVLRPSGVNTPAGRRSRAVAAERVAAERVGTDDLHGWLRDRYAAGWSLVRLAAAVAHSTHWVRWRLDAPSGRMPGRAG